MNVELEMNLVERAKITLRWSSASLAISVLTFLATVFYVYKYRSTKAAFIAGSASISVLTLLILHVLIISSILGQGIQFSITSALVGIQYSFAFYTVFYAFNCLIRNGSKIKKLAVYFGYIWIVITIPIGIAASVILAGDSNSISATAYNNLSGLLSFISYSIWGFIAIALLLFFMNKKLLNRKAKFAMLAFIGLNAIPAITAIAMGHSNAIDIQLIMGIYLFLGELPIYLSIIVAASYGSTWIQNSLNKNYIASRTESNDLEANPPH